MLKKCIRSTLRARPPVIIASYGRGGSTLLYEAVVDAYSQASFGTTNSIVRKLFRDRAFLSLQSDFNHSVVYKTHLPANEVVKFQNAPRVVYVYSDPIQAALSVIMQAERNGYQWLENHMKNLQAERTSIFASKTDPFCFETNLKSWLDNRSVPVLFLKYEYMWDYSSIISNFLEADIILPARKARQAVNANGDLMDRCFIWYHDLKTKLDTLPPVYCNRKTLSNALGIEYIYSI